MNERLIELIKRNFSEDELVGHIGQACNNLIDEDAVLYINGQRRVFHIKCSKEHERDLLFSKACEKIKAIQFSKAGISQ